MKRSVIPLLTLTLLSALAACSPKPQESPAAGKYAPGTYEGSAQGYGGEVKASVTVDDNAITGVTLTGEQETPAVGGAALEDLAAQAKEKGADMDGVAGATVTSDAAKKAVAGALEAAGSGKG